MSYSECFKFIRAKPRYSRDIAYYVLEYCNFIRV